MFVVAGERWARLECVGGWSEDSQGLVAGVALFEDDLHLGAGFGGDEWLLGCEVGGVEVGVLFGGARAGGEQERDGETEQGWWQRVAIHGRAIYNGMGEMLVIFLRDEAGEAVNHEVHPSSPSPRLRRTRGYGGQDGGQGGGAFDVAQGRRRPFRGTARYPETTRGIVPYNSDAKRRV